MPKPRSAASRKPLKLDEEAGLAYIGDNPLPFLSDFEFDALKYLLERRDKVVTTAQLFYAVYCSFSTGPKDNNRAALLIRRLRKKIEPNWRKPVYLMTASNRGYILKSEGR